MCIGKLGIFPGNRPKQYGFRVQSDAKCYQTLVRMSQGCKCCGAVARYLVIVQQRFLNRVVGYHFNGPFIIRRWSPPPGLRVHLSLYTIYILCSRYAHNSYSYPKYPPCTRITDRLRICFDFFFNYLVQRKVLPLSVRVIWVAHSTPAHENPQSAIRGYPEFDPSLVCWKVTNTPRIPIINPMQRSLPPLRISLLFLNASWCDARTQT